MSRPERLPQTFDLIMGPTACIRSPVSWRSVRSTSSCTTWAATLRFQVPNYLGLHRQTLGCADVGRTAAIYPVRGTGEARVILLWRTQRCTTTIATISLCSGD